ncbi:hypothetical protein BH10PLA2_BH10PLA2_05690 [soil metagenome]
MATLIPGNFESVAPTEGDIRVALESSRYLASREFGKRSTIQIRVEDGDNAEPVLVPASAVRLFLHVLAEMSQGNAVTLIPTHAELTTQQAADLLNVSRPYVLKLLDEGKMPFRMVGEFRRIRFEDLMVYKREDDELRAKSADELTALSQELGGMGY